jgi:hypothetical protein
VVRQKAMKTAELIFGLPKILTDGRARTFAKVLIFLTCLTVVTRKVLMRLRSGF